MRLNSVAGTYSLAAFSSLLFLPAFPPCSLWPLAFVCLAPLLYALRDVPLRIAFRLGGLFAFLFYVGLLHWIVFNPAVESWARPLLYLGVGLIAAYLALFIAAAILIARWITLRLKLPVWLVLPFAWTLADYIRSLGIMGFPWGSIGYAATRFLPAIQMAELTGVWGLVFWMVLVNGILYCSIGRIVALIRERRSPARSEWIGLNVGVLLFLFPVIGGQLRLRQVEPRIGDAPRIKIALIQGNIEQGLRWDREFQDFNWRTYRDLSRRAANEHPGLIIWPETAMPFYLRYQDRYLSQMTGLVDEINTPILTGVPDFIQDYPSERISYYNSSFLFVPSLGLTGQYAKSHLAPFGERFPLKEHIPFIRN
ncbi:MAG: apolipoprotein N-acyltransferase, partial [Candidatus Edwardsbacteria bacterium]|nr:apolipoprotein N-acyltransferase [Candidatus Edwardsbacteria bacterium]